MREQRAQSGHERCRAVHADSRDPDFGHDKKIHLEMLDIYCVQLH